MSQHNELSGRADHVLQAGNVHGDVHFHTSAKPSPPVPRQLPPAVAHFTGGTPR